MVVILDNRARKFHPFITIETQFAKEEMHILLYFGWPLQLKIAISQKSKKDDFSNFEV